MAEGKIEKPHGLWPAPVSAEVISQGQRLGELAWSRDGNSLVWHVEANGEGALWCSNMDGEAPRRLTIGQSVKARVGYGGGHFALGRSTAGQTAPQQSPGEDFVVFCGDGGRLYRQALAGGTARAITPPGIVAASPSISPDGAWVLYVFEVEDQNGLALVDAHGRGWPRKVAEGHDFYMQPTWHPGGLEIAWVTWDHPNMPWDGTQLYTMDLQPMDPNSPHGGWSMSEPQHLAGGPDESVLQPRYAPDGSALAYVSDAGDWYRLHVAPQDGTGLPGKALTEDAAEYGGPAWAQGMSWFDWLPDSSGFIATRNSAGQSTLVRVEYPAGAVHPFRAFQSNYSEAGRPAVHPANGAVAALVGNEWQPPRVVVQSNPAAKAPAVLHRSGVEFLEQQQVSALQPVEWPAADGTMVHGLYAAPQHTHYTAQGAPPLIVNVHGGPTSQVTAGWRPEVQFFTGRGYAVLELNHRGSSGYGRHYRNLLRGQWGVVDVEDCETAIAHLAGQGLADPTRCAVRGGSAGGYTVLRALTAQPDLFRVGVCLYGISDLFALADETHKFEARYLDSLIGPLPQTAERYRERSPLFSAERITAPLIVFQGSEDKVVPPVQSEKIVASLARRGVPHEYHLYPGEGHGFRKRENLLACWQATDRFLRANLLFA